MNLDTVFENTLIKLLHTRELQDCLVMGIMDKHVVELQKLIREIITDKVTEITPIINTSFLLKTIADSAVEKNSEYIKQQMEKVIHTEEFKTNIANVLVDSIKNNMLNLNVSVD